VKLPDSWGIALTFILLIGVCAAVIVWFWP
jgi:hypothetical protein